LSANNGPPTLTDAKGMGGVIAQDGFDYQLWDGLVRLPAWLANPAFEQAIFEGLDDLEARFFAPQAPREYVLERYQAKGGSLTPGGVRDVLESFLAFESAFPQAARVQTLVTPRLPPTLSWLARDPMRVRRARPFYLPFADVLAASDAQLRADLVDAFGVPLGPFVASAVEVSERNLPDRDSALQAFAIALGRAFGALDIGARRIEQAFEALGALARRNIGTPLARGDLIKVMEVEFGQILPRPAAFPLHIRSDRNERDETALEIDASEFSGGTKSFPGTDQWTEGLLAPLNRTAGWLRRLGVARIGLRGSYRLSTAMSLGWSFRSAIGFELEIPTRDGPWRTDDRSGMAAPSLPWRIAEPATLDGDQLVVCIGVLRDPSLDLPITAAGGTECLAFHLAAPIVSGAAAQAGVSLVKRTIDAAVARLRPAGIKLFMAGPAAFAAALGHRWNAMPPTQLHEFLPADRSYVPTVRL
jgi:SMODS-associated and fused to various effectors sensor domain